MKKVDKIMIAIDFSEYSLPTAKYAAELATDLSADLLLVNVLNQKDVDVMYMIATKVSDFDMDVYLKDSLCDRQKGLQDIAGKLGFDKNRIEMKTCVGVPYKKLLEEIEKSRPDLLVMGTKGRSNIVDMIIGSCAQKMFRHSPIPLLSLRKP